ncbi:MAG: VWA domain-containing protein [Candidatus Poseidoniales archaeon]|nr:VWA domain-containing protein [Candidatus Poseidoniales archaeon]
MPKITANLTKDIAIANQSLVSQGMISLAPDENSSTLPLDLVMVLDVSGSMSGTGIQVVIDSVLYIQNMMSPQDRLAIITFNSSARLHSSWVGKNDTISALTAGGGTNFGSAINELLNFLGQHGGDSGRAGIALFMSDGQGGKAADDHVSSIPDFGYTMHCLGVTSGAVPDHLEHMAELARGRYFDAPGFDDVKKKFAQLFNYGKTTIYSAPVLELDVVSGVTLSEVMEVNGTALSPGSDLGPGKHSLALCNMTQGNVSQVSFKINVDNVNLGENKLVDIEFMGARGALNVKGTNVDTDVLNANTNNAVTVSRTTAKATRALKDGNTEQATRLVTKLETMGKTVPTATSSATILGTVLGTTDKGQIHEAIGTITVDTKGETVTRDD